MESSADASSTSEPILELTGKWPHPGPHRSSSAQSPEMLSCGDGGLVVASRGSIFEVGVDGKDIERQKDGEEKLPTA
jgi:hypothetical protein